MQCGHTQRGNILFLILLVVILFAALTYAVNSGLRGGGNDISSEKADELAAQMMQYASLVENTVTRLRLVNNCADTQISFSNATVVIGGNSNANAPADKSCHVFDPAGGALAYQNVPEAALVSTTRSFYTGNYVFGASTPIINVGTGPLNAASAAELTIWTYGIRADVCQKINDRLGISGIPNNGASFNTGYVFQGSYGAGGQINVAGLSTKTSGCFYHNSAGYIFYHVLIAR